MVPNCGIRSLAQRNQPYAYVGYAMQRHATGLDTTQHGGS